MAAQTTAASPSEESKPISTWILPVLAAWVIPGGGHFLQKRPGADPDSGLRGLMFLFGMFMRGMMFTPERGDILTTLINYGGFVCDLASGVFTSPRRCSDMRAPDMPGDVHDYGTKFLVTAGLLNILAMVDAYEIATGKKD